MSRKRHLSEVNTEETLDGWSKKDKLKLLHGIKSFGSPNIEEIADFLGNKTTEEVRDAIQFYKKKSAISVIREEPKGRKRARSSKEIFDRAQIPLSNWVKLLTNNIEFDDLQTETSAALRLIADFEDHPAPQDVGGFDFKQVYHALANALDGRTVYTDNFTKAAIDNSLFHTAIYSKQFMAKSVLMGILKSLNLSKEQVYFNGPTLNNSQLILRHLSCQKSFNPFQIPEEYLKK